MIDMGDIIEIAFGLSIVFIVAYLVVGAIIWFVSWTWPVLLALTVLFILGVKASC